MVLVSHVNVGQTIVQNTFIDRYMAAANGEYVKVYLLLLRLAGSRELTVSQIADRLDITEKDVMRAISYWENAGLIRLSRRGDDLTEMIINSFDADRAAAEKRPAEEAAPQQEAAPEEPARKAAKEPVKELLTEPEPAPVRPCRTSEELAEDEDFVQLVYVAEKYLARTLKPKDLELLAWMYDGLEFPADVIEYLIEYCADSGKKKTEYLKSVAIGWHEDGISTLEQAKQQVRAYRLSTGNYYSVLKAFGIYGRAAVEREEQLVDKWTGQWGMPIEVVQMACAEAMRKNVKQPFDYTDKILKSWKEQGVKSPADAERQMAAGREGFRQMEVQTAQAVQLLREERRREDDRRGMEREVLAERRAALLQDIPDYEAVEAEIIDLSARRDLELLNGADARADALKQRIVALREKKSGLLKAAGLPEDYLERV